MFVFHFVDPDLRVEILFRKEGTTENGGIHFEIGDIDPSAHCYWRLEKISCRACQLFYYFFGDKKKLKNPFGLCFHPFIIEFLYFALLQFKIEEKIQIKVLCF